MESPICLLRFRKQNTRAHPGYDFSYIQRIGMAHLGWSLVSATSRKQVVHWWHQTCPSLVSGRKGTSTFNYWDQALAHNPADIRRFLEGGTVFERVMLRFCIRISVRFTQATCLTNQLIFHSVLHHPTVFREPSIVGIADHHSNHAALECNILHPRLCPFFTPEAESLAR